MKWGSTLHIHANGCKIWGTLCCLLCCLVMHTWAQAQSFVADSLKNELNQPLLKLEVRAITMAKLARSLYEVDMPAALNYAHTAIQVSNGLADGKYKAFAFATLTYLNVQRDSVLLAGKNMDSALLYAEKTTDKEVKGYVWLRKGWLAYIVNHTDKAMAALLHALQLLKGENAYEYESLIYHYLASVYADLKQPDKLKKYTLLSLQTAYKTANPDIICNAYLAMGSSYLKQYRQDSGQKAWLDSALYYNRQLLAMAQANPKRIINHSNVAAAALNTGNMYWEFYPRSYKDSAEKYIGIALNIARQTKHEEVIANCYGIMSEYALADGDYATAEKLFLMGFAEIERTPNSSNQVKAAMMKGLANVAEKSGDKTKALHYYKEYLQYEAQAYNTGKLAVAQRLELQYESEKKDRELQALQERATFNSKLNVIYIGLAIASLLALVFLFRSYHFRLQASIQQQKLKVEETARLKAEQELLQERQERLQKELLAGTLQVEEKNELLHTLRDKLEAATEGGVLKKQVDRMIKENQKMDEDLELAKNHLANIHPDFFNRLQQKAANGLTRLDLKYCAYILTGLSNKEIAQRLAVDPKSIRMARYRIKQKLQLQKDDNLDEVIRKMG